jgi:uncharacterized protein YlzI (FlbEa/FlbD family)
MQNRNIQRFIFLTQDISNPEEVIVNLDHIKYIRKNTDSDKDVRFHDDRAVLEFIDGMGLIVEESLNEVSVMIDESDQSIPQRERVCREHQ